MQETEVSECQTYITITILLLYYYFCLYYFYNYRFSGCRYFYRWLKLIHYCFRYSTVVTNAADSDVADAAGAAGVDDAHDDADDVEADDADDAYADESSSA